LTRLIAAEGYRVKGVDTSEQMLAEARKLDFAGTEMNFERAIDNGKSLPDAAYDGIVCSSTIEFVVDADALLKNFHRILRHTGVLVISFSNRSSIWRAYSATRYRDTTPHLKIQHNVWSYKQFKDILAKNGFVVAGTPVYFEAAPFDTRSYLRWLSPFWFVGTLGLVVALKSGKSRGHGS
jgi:ubiquinone/menaquinone biosynthesis C-methylase UbiE